jgi:hypothetical protein
VPGAEPSASFLESSAVCRDSDKKMVEAVGVEPTSENVTGQEPTYLVRSPDGSYPARFAACAQNGQETQDTSPNVLSRRPGPARETSLLYDALAQPVDKAV